MFAEVTYNNSEMGSSNNNKHNSGATNSGHHIELVFPVAGHPQPSCSGSSWACPRLILSPQKVGRQYTFFSMFFHVFPCFSQNMLNSLTGYFTTEMGKLHWSGTFAATFPVTNSVLRTSFSKPHLLHLRHVLCCSDLGEFSTALGGLW